jgi:hypothetical protein
MRPLLAHLAVALVLGGAPASTAVLAAPLAPRPADPALPRLGLVLDAGLPAGAGLLLQARPLDAVRLQAGPMWSGVGWGVKGGVVLAPFRAAVTPTLEAEAGYGFRADLSFLAGRSDVPRELKPVLARARYWFVAGYLGLDLGSQRGLSFFVRGGLARLRVTAPGTARTTTSGGALEIGDATLDATVPCAKLGLQLWF